MSVHEGLCEAVIDLTDATDGVINEVGCMRLDGHQGDHINVAEFAPAAMSWGDPA